MSDAIDPRYPIGRFVRPDALDDDQRRDVITRLAALPSQLREAVAGMSTEQLDTPYRDGGWTVRQVVHHVPDSHLNAYVRTKLALTEDVPTVKPYEEEAWALLPDTADTPVEVTLALVDALHARWVTLLQGMPKEAFARRWRHPVSGEHTIDQLLALYAWHGAHHVAHVTRLRARMGW
jgi:uncharacterized damage-inducible protein DinB